MKLKKKRKKVRKYLDNHADIPGSKKYPDKILAEKLYQHMNTSFKGFNNQTAQEYLKSVRLETPSVYAIGNWDEGYVKIGYSIDVESRIKQIQTGCPFEVEIIKVWEGLGRREERTLHKAYAIYQAYGEWFEIKGKLKRDLIK